MKTIRASELNAYLYCQRAWWYQISGAESENTAEILMGQAVHEGHARSVKAVGCLRTLAAVLLPILLSYEKREPSRSRVFVKAALSSLFVIPTALRIRNETLDL